MRFPTDVKHATTSQCLQCSYNACMPAVTIRDVPDDTRDMLASRAAQRGQSLQEYLRSALIDLASQADIGELIANARARKASTDAGLNTSEILQHLSADRK